MYKDPTDFRKRFLAYKNGKMPYKNGRPIEDEEFESFRQTLPDNQKLLGDYRTRRYWELNDKPKTFGEAIGRGMYNLGDSKLYGQYGIEIPAWHANSVAYDQSSGNYEFMKPNTHSTRWMEDVYGYWGSDMQDFRENYKLQKGPVYDKYVPKKNVYKLPKFKDGKDKYPITTGGAGYIPESDVVSAVKKAAHNYAFGDLPIDTVRQRLYENIQPAGYNDALRRVHRAVVENDPNDHADLDFIPTRPDRFARDYRDNIFAEYLLIPKEKRHNIASHKIIPSKYRPTKGDSPNNKYFKIDESTAWKPIWGRVYNAVYKHKNFFGTTKPLLINQNAIRPAIYDVLGKHTVGRGYDERGEYMSYADVWDLSPYGFGGEHDQSNGVGKPVHIYDRMYLDDYYGVPEPTHSTYLPEIVVTGRLNPIDK